MKIAILSTHSHGNEDLARVTAQNKWDYSARHGYDLITLRMEWADCIRGAILKLIEILKRYDAVMMIGSDVIFMNHDIKIEDLLAENDNVVMARELLRPSDPENRGVGGGSTINNDVSIWKRTPHAEFLLWSIHNSYPTWKNFKWLWQEWLMWEMDNPDRVASKAIRLVEPRVMNATLQEGIDGSGKYQEGDYILHLVDYSNENKLLLATQVLATKREKESSPNKMVFLPLIDNGGGSSRNSFLISYAAAFCGRFVQMALISDSLAGRARNKATADFLLSDCDEMVFIDGDIVFSRQNVDDLFSHDVELVAGAYPIKQLKPRLCLHTLEDHVGDPEAILVPVKRAGTGFMRIHRSVFEKIRDAGLAPIYNNHGRPEWDFWQCGVVDGEYLSEDWFFCDLWRKIGGTVWVDQRINLRHEGTCLYPVTKDQLE